MKPLLVVTLLLSAFAAEALAICDIPPPPPPPKPKMPGEKAPTDNPLDPDGTVGPLGPRSTPRPRRPGAATGRGMVGYGKAWRIWWELNQVQFVGLRNEAPAVEGPAEPGGSVADPMERFRTEVRALLRAVAAQAQKPELQRTALVALGRIGNEDDARLFLQILRSRTLPEQTLEGAAIGLASLGEISDEEARAGLRKLYDDLLAGKLELPGKAHLTAVLALSLRSRSDLSLVRSLGARFHMRLRTSDEAAAYIYACGLTRNPVLVPEVAQAVRTGAVGRKSINDIGRGHAVLALAMSGDSEYVPALVDALSGEDLQAQTRRSAAIALGVVLREGVNSSGLRWKAVRALRAALDADKDNLVRGFSAMALGGAKEPIGVDVLTKAVNGAPGDVRPFAALAIGLAARRSKPAMAEHLRGFLVDTLAKGGEPELVSALILALGVSRTDRARDDLVKRAASSRTSPEIRGSACEALGLLGEQTPAVQKVLYAALAGKSHTVVEDAAIALGRLGRPGTARILVDRLIRTKSEPVQAHMVVALGRLTGGEVIPMLIEVLRDRSKKHTIRRSAAASLGILLDPRESDPLFDIDACANPYGFTHAVRELVRTW